MSRYFGTADISYRVMVKHIEATNLSRERKDKLLEELDILVGHMLDDIDFRLRNQYSGYYYYRSTNTYIKERPRGWAALWYSPRELLLEVMHKALSHLSDMRKKFREAGYVSRI